jgi:molybdopterin-guanine dinucleotide biosynthesis protein MobB
MTSPVIGIAGWKNSGKTTLVTKLIAELTRRGFRVASVKHAHHPAREILAARNSRLAHHAGRG